MSSLTGKAIIITGAGGGIGRGMASLFARNGAKLVLSGRTAATLEETQRLVNAEGSEAIIVVSDVTRGSDCERMVTDGVKAFGRIDAAVNNAAVDGELKLLADYDEAVFDEVVATNFKGVWNCMRYQIPHMVSAGGGAIVNISSTTTFPTVSHMSAYVASKYAVHALTKSAAFEYAKHGVRANALLAGATKTPMLEDYGKDDPSLLTGLLSAIPAGRFAEVEDIGRAAAWLCSDESSYVTGAELTCDGGHALRGGRN